MTRPVAPAPRQAMGRRDFRQGVRKGGLRSPPIHRAPWPETDHAASHQVGAVRTRRHRAPSASRTSRPAAYAVRAPSYAGCRLRRACRPRLHRACHSPEPAGPNTGSRARAHRPAPCPGCGRAPMPPRTLRYGGRAHRPAADAERAPREPPGPVRRARPRLGRACAARATRPCAPDGSHLGRACRRNRPEAYVECVPPAQAVPSPEAGRPENRRRAPRAQRPVPRTRCGHAGRPVSCARCGRAGSRRRAGHGPVCPVRRARSNTPPQPPTASRTNALRNLPAGSSPSATRRKSPSRG